MNTQEIPVNLPEDVKSLIDQQDMTGAVERLLKSNPRMEKGQAMKAVLHYQMNKHKSGFFLKRLVKPPEAPSETWTIPYTIVNVGMFLSVVWMFINTFVLVASLIILFNIDGYRPAELTVTDTYYVSDDEGGDSWGVHGTIDGTALRFSDPSLLPADGESPGRFMARNHPPGSTMMLLYNPDVTDELFQNRTLNVIVWSADPAAAETQRVLAWLARCLLPFLGFLFASWLMRKTTTTVKQSS